jgi:redox-sensitive bicupin YhaK (pirin superfamily)
MTNNIKISQVITGRMQNEGDGAKVVRTVGSSQMDVYDPFLLLDEFYVSPPAGFPSHPHRGFSTVTYMLNGAFKHADNKGNRGTINAGEVQWMTAGKGIIHSEMPATNSVNHGLQLWVNLPAKAKMIPPSYQDLTAQNMVHKQVTENTHVTVIAGKSETANLESILKLYQEIMYLDITMTKAGDKYSDIIPAKYQGFFYILSGSGKLKGSSETYSHKQSLFFSASQEPQEFEWEAVNASSSEPFRYVVISAEPLNEPVARYGPFVMNTENELRQAFLDYQSGRF